MSEVSSLCGTIRALKISFIWNICTPILCIIIILLSCWCQVFTSPSTIKTTFQKYIQTASNLSHMIGFFSFLSRTRPNHRRGILSTGRGRRHRLGHNHDWQVSKGNQISTGWWVWNQCLVLWLYVHVLCCWHLIYLFVVLLSILFITFMSS